MTLGENASLTHVVQRDDTPEANSLPLTLSFIVGKISNIQKIAKVA